jgi:hypothetical protein
MNTLIRITALVVVVACSAGGCAPHVRVAGRLAFGESDGCRATHDGQVVRWSDCHAFKRHFTPATGEPVTADSWVAGTLRPLSSAIDITYSKVNDDGSTKQCGRGVYRADRDGYFQAYIPACGGGRTRVVARPFLHQAAWQIEDGSPINLGWIRAVWREREATEVFPNLSNEGTSPGQVYAYEVEEGEGASKQKVRYATPSLGFTFEVEAEPDTKEQGAVIPVGTQVFLTDATDDQFGYLRQVLSAFQTIVELHARLKRHLRDDPESYDRLFPPNPQFQSGSPTYLVAFNDGWAHGGASSMSVYRPDLAKLRQPGGVGTIAWLLSDTSTLGHEFGHSIHATLAGGTMTRDGAFGITMLRPDGTEYSWGHFPGQFQENGFAFVEGVASALGQFLLNECGGAVAAQRPAGGVVPFAGNPWSGDTACDDTAPGNMCAFHYVRAELRRRGVGDPNSQAWKDRTAALRSLTAVAVAAGHGNVTYNNEWRWAGFGCDILDADTNVTHAAATNNAQYVRNFTQAVGEVLDGRSVSAETARFPATAAAPEDVRVPLPRFIAAMAAFCPSCAALPAGPSGEAYNRDRLSASQGAQSPQAFGRYLESQGLLTRAQLRNLLRTNFMDDNP